MVTFGLILCKTGICQSYIFSSLILCHTGIQEVTELKTKLNSVAFSPRANHPQKLAITSPTGGGRSVGMSVTELL